MGHGVVEFVDVKEVCLGREDRPDAPSRSTPCKHVPEIEAPWIVGRIGSWTDQELHRRHLVARELEIASACTIDHVEHLVGCGREHLKRGRFRDTGVGEWVADDVVAVHDFAVRDAAGLGRFVERPTRGSCNTVGRRLTQWGEALRLDRFTVFAAPGLAGEWVEEERREACEVGSFRFVDAVVLENQLCPAEHMDRWVWELVESWDQLGGRLAHQHADDGANRRDLRPRPVVDSCIDKFAHALEGRQTFFYVSWLDEKLVDIKSERLDGVWPRRGVVGVGRLLGIIGRGCSLVPCVANR